MLINKGFSTNDVVTLKLTSGEELVGRFVEETDTHIKLSKIMVLTMGPQGVGMVPYLFTVESDREIPISLSTVVVKVESAKDSASQYIQATTGIKLA